MRDGKIVLRVRFFGCLPLIVIGAFTERIHFYLSMLCEKGGNVGLSGKERLDLYDFQAWIASSEYRDRGQAQFVETLAACLHVATR